MKKAILIAVALISIGFTSCKKDWTCTCTDADGDTWDIPITNSRRPEASTACKLFEYGADENCKLK